jgi:hypothetical protein
MILTEWQYHFPLQILREEMTNTVVIVGDLGIEELPNTPPTPRTNLY